MSFTGIPRETFAFLADLGANNNKGWFEANRQRYESHFRDVGFALIEALAPAMKAADPPLKAEARINGSLRRINRDVRFSKDKTPYQDWMHVVFWAGGHPNRSPGMHFVIGKDGLGYGAGMWGIEKDDLSILRKRICQDGDRTALLGALDRAASVGCTLGQPELVKVPKGYEADGDWEHLLRRKSFVARTHEGRAMPDWLTTPSATAELEKIARACQPLIRWLSA